MQHTCIVVWALEAGISTNNPSRGGEGNGSNANARIAIIPGIEANSDYGLKHVLSYTEVEG